MIRNRFPAPPYAHRLNEGKTKIIYPHPEDRDLVRMFSKPDITAGDGAKHDKIASKGVWANQTTCNVFRLLAGCNVPTAFVEQWADDWLIAKKCTMLPYEVVIRREAHGSYLKRHPNLMKGHVFPRLVVEFYLKTSGKKWKERELVCDDPLMYHNYDTEEIYLFDPKTPNHVQQPASPFLTLNESEVFRDRAEEDRLKKMEVIARKVFLILEKAWQLQGRKLVDMKVEFGLDSAGNLLLADVIDNDSWRVVGEGGYIDKQVYRDGGSLDEVASKYQLVAELTGRFHLPVQRITFWRHAGMNTDSFYEPIHRLFPTPQFAAQDLLFSAHTEPGVAYKTLQLHLQEVPDTVIVAIAHGSNALGPMLAANATVPMITVPANYAGFPHDVWSSLRVPDNVPVMTVLEPANATIAALQILGMRNPAVYAALRYDQEQRLAPLD